MNWEERLKLHSEKFHQHFGGEVRMQDFVSSEHYNPKYHLNGFLRDWDWDKYNQKRIFIPRRKE